MKKGGAVKKGFTLPENLAMQIIQQKVTFDG